MTTKSEIDLIIYDIGNLIHVRYKGWWRGKLLTPKEIIDSYEFKMEFEKAYPHLCKFILDAYKKIRRK